MVSTYWPSYTHEPLKFDQRSHVSDRWAPLWWISRMGEAAAMQRIRRHLFEDRGLPRSQASVRGYWKHGRSGDADDA
jgi:NADPH-dependent ferric siderophore reductase